MRLPLNDTKEVAVADPNVTRNLGWRFSRFISLANLSHFVFRNPPLCHPRCCAAIGSALFEHVRDVVLLRSQEQVIRIDAQRRVATMKYPQARWDRSVVDYVREAVCVNHALIISRYGSKRSVAIRLLSRLSSNPEPACRGMLNLCSKSLPNRPMVSVHEGHGAGVFTELPSPDLRLGYKDLSAAEKTVEWYSCLSQGVTSVTGCVVVGLSKVFTHLREPFLCAL